MGERVEGGDLIQIVEIDQDFCENYYGESFSAGNIYGATEEFDYSYWNKTGYVIPNVEQPPVAGFYSGADECVRGPSGKGIIEYTKFSTSISTAYVWRLHMKAGNESDARLTISFGGNTTILDVDLDAGTKSLVSGSPTSTTITSLGNGWYEVEIEETTSLGDSISMQVDLVDGYGGGSLILWGAQLFQGVPADYNYVGNRGLGNCTAVLGTDGDQKCYNTLPTCQDTANYTNGVRTLRFCSSNYGAPKEQYYVPSIKSVQTTPSRLNTSSRNRDEPLGTRAKATAVLFDHPHNGKKVDVYYAERVSGDAVDGGVGYDPVDFGTYWTKWRARNLYYVGRPMRVYQGVTSDGRLDVLTKRYYEIEKIEGPDSAGTVTITGKDPLKKLDDDRAQVPQKSVGELPPGGLGSSATTFDVDPTGAGSTYASSGYIRINDEIISFTRSGDTFTLSRSQFGTTAAAHGAGDLVQECALFLTGDAATHAYELVTTWGGIDTSFINQSDWDDEAAQYLAFNYDRIISDPMSVSKALGELAEQAGFSLWWDEIDQLIRFSAVKQPGAGALTLDDSILIKDSVVFKDKPDARISQVWTNYTRKSYVEENSFSATLVTVDSDAGGTDQYGQEAVRKINGTWIPDAGQTTAADLNDRLISRYRDIIREVEFMLPSYYGDLVKMGGVHKIDNRQVTDIHGSPTTVSVRIMSAEQIGDRIKYVGEEVRFFNTPDPNDLTVIIDTDSIKLDMRELFDSVYSITPTASTDITFIISPGVVVGSDDSTVPAFSDGDIGSYTYNSLTLINYGTISGKGGKGANSETTTAAGEDGGDALYTRTAFSLDNQGVIQGGGGGGGSGDRYVSPKFGIIDGGAGGGGAGYYAGNGGASGRGGEAGSPGSLTAGGAGGTGPTRGGGGGDPATAGASGGGGGTSGGAAGVAIDGDSYITYTTTGTITGSQIN